MGEIKIPQANDAERAVIGCLLFTPATALQIVSASGLRARDFFAQELGQIYLAIQSSADAGESLEPMVLAHRLASKGIPFATLSDLSASMPSLHGLRDWCDLVRETAMRRALQKIALQAADAISSGETTSEIVRQIGAAVTVASASQGLGEVRQTSFAELLDYDTSTDPNSLIGNRWLCKGGSLLLNAQSGIGKSSLTMQLAIGWALDPDHVLSQHFTFGMRAVAPLKSLIIQAENDTGDQAEILQSVVSKMPANLNSPLTKDDLDGLTDRLIFYRDNVHAGPEFLRVLEALVLRHEPDLAWIDPLMCYVGDDLSDQRVVTEFCNGLNRISSKTGVVFCIIHHLPKPKEGVARTESDLAYAGFGSSALTNWAREVATMQRVEVPEGHPPTCSLTMTKRRTRAGLKIYKTETPATRIFIRHSKDVKSTGMVWIECAKPEPEEDEPKKKWKR